MSTSSEIVYQNITQSQDFQKHYDGIARLFECVASATMAPNDLIH